MEHLLFPISDEEAKEYVRDFLKDSLIEGLGMNLSKGYVRVRVRTENGEEEVKISIPRKIVSQ